MADAIENLDSTNGTVPASETADERLSRLEETNKRLYQRTKDAEAEAKEARAKAAEVKPAISEQATKPSDILKSPEFRLHRDGYTEEEIEIIMNNGGPTLLEKKTHPVVLGIQASRQQRQAEDAASKVNDSTGASDIERKFTEAQMRSMSKEELAKLLPHTE